jgi:hypothetical protein
VISKQIAKLNEVFTMLLEMNPNNVRVLKMYAYFLADHYSRDKQAIDLLRRAANYTANTLTSGPALASDGIASTWVELIFDRSSFGEIFRIHGELTTLLSLTKSSIIG